MSTPAEITITVVDPVTDEHIQFTGSTQQDLDHQIDTHFGVDEANAESAQP